MVSCIEEIKKNVRISTATSLPLSKLVLIGLDVTTRFRQHWERHEVRSPRFVWCSAMNNLFTVVLWLHLLSFLTGLVCDWKEYFAWLREEFFFLLYVWPIIFVQLLLETVAEKWMNVHNYISSCCAGLCSVTPYLIRGAVPCLVHVPYHFLPCVSCHMKSCCAASYGVLPCRVMSCRIKFCPLHHVLYRDESYHAVSYFVAYAVLCHVIPTHVLLVMLLSVRCRI